MKKKYTNARDMQKAAEDYFISCQGVPLLDDSGNIVRDKNGQAVIVGRRPITVTGLCLALGFSQRKSLIDYAKDKRFKEVIGKAKLRCMQYAEERLYDKEGHNGAKFNLTYNFGYAQEKEEEKEESCGITEENATAALYALGYVKREDI